MRRSVSLLVLWVMSLAVSQQLAHAGPKSIVDQCLQRGELSKSLLDGQRSFALGRASRLFLLSAGTDGVVCLVRRVGGTDKIIDSRSGPGTTGGFGDFSETGLMKIGDRDYLRTEQFFRGGSNAIRDYYILYEVKRDRIHQVLKLPEHLGLVIYDYEFSEENTLTAGKKYLKVRSVQTLRKGFGDSDKVQLYKTTRDFRLKYFDKYSSFLNGTATCTQDMYLGKDAKLWCQKGDQLGYLIVPQFAENGGGLSFDLVKPGGTQRKTVFYISHLAALSMMPAHQTQ